MGCCGFDVSVGFVRLMDKMVARWVGTVFHRFGWVVRFNPCGVASSNLEGWVIHPKGDLIEGYVYMCGSILSVTLCLVCGCFFSCLCFGFTYSICSLSVRC